MHVQNKVEKAMVGYKIILSCQHLVEKNVKSTFFKILSMADRCKGVFPYNYFPISFFPFHSSHLILPVSFGRWASKIFCMSHLAKTWTKTCISLPQTYISYKCHEYIISQVQHMLESELHHDYEYASCCSNGMLAGALRSAGSWTMSSQSCNDCFAISRLASFWT